MALVNRWIDNGFSLRGGKDDLGFLFFLEIMTGTLNIKIHAGDNPYQLGTLLLRYFWVLLVFTLRLCTPSYILNLKSLLQITTRQGSPRDWPVDVNSACA